MTFDQSSSLLFCSVLIKDCQWLSNFFTIAVLLPSGDQLIKVMGILVIIRTGRLSIHFITLILLVLCCPYISPLFSFTYAPQGGVLFLFRLEIPQTNVALSIVL